MLAPALLALAVFALLGLYFVPDEFFGGGGRARLPCVGPNCARPSMRPIHPALENGAKPELKDPDGFLAAKERQRRAQAAARFRASNPKANTSGAETPGSAEAGAAEVGSSLPVLSPDEIGRGE